jgi:hypothetical protein
VAVGEPVAGRDSSRRIASLYNAAAHQTGSSSACSPGLTGHFAFHRNSAIPTVILGGNDSFHFAFHPEKDGNVRMAGLSSLQKMEISIL